MHPSFEQFVAALRDPALRPGIRLAISDQDAATLLTRSDWANDYYARWVALFPVAVTEPASAVSQYGPPPTAASSGGSGETSTWTVLPRRKLSPWARIAIIVVITFVALWTVGGVLNAVATTTRTSPVSLTGIQPPITSPPSPGSARSDDPVVFHGLTQSEYNLLEAALVPQGHTLEQAVAQGADDAELGRLAQTTESTMAKTCTDGEALESGFDNSAFRASFIAGYESAQNATPAQAAAVYDALAAYCDHH